MSCVHNPRSDRPCLWSCSPTLSTFCLKQTRLQPQFGYSHLSAQSQPWPPQRSTFGQCDRGGWRCRRQWWRPFNRAPRDGTKGHKKQNKKCGKFGTKRKQYEAVLLASQLPNEWKELGVIVIYPHYIPRFFALKSQATLCATTIPRLAQWWPTQARRPVGQCDLPVFIHCSVWICHWKRKYHRNIMAISWEL